MRKATSLVQSPMQALNILLPVSAKSWLAAGSITTMHVESAPCLTVTVGVEAQVRFMRGAGAGEGRKALRVSLRVSRGGEWEGRDPDPGGDPAPEELGLSALRINQPVRPFPLGGPESVTLRPLPKGWTPADPHPQLTLDKVSVASNICQYDPRSLEFVWGCQVDWFAGVRSLRRACPWQRREPFKLRLNPPACRQLQ